MICVLEDAQKTDLTDGFRGRFVIFQHGFFVLACGLPKGAETQAKLDFGR